MEIRMARGDILTKTFTIRNSDGTPYYEDLDEIYFTVKSNANDRDYKLQKRMTEGEITLVDAGKYQFTLMPDDTNDLTFSKYAFDIEIVKMPTLKKTFIGDMYIDKEVTHAYNEGG